MSRSLRRSREFRARTIRVVRAAPEGNLVALGGYHGQDWYIGSTSHSKWVPASTRTLAYKFWYNNHEGFEALFAEHSVGSKG